MSENEQLIAILEENRISLHAALVFETNHLDSNEESKAGELVKLLQNLVGNEGILVVPTCSPAQGYPKPAFDPIQTPSEMGWFSNYFRSLPGVGRSNNATHSIAVWGAQGSKIITDHRFASGRQSPWGESAFGHDSP
jgi:aminoglycoside N3'-acetyltransferase